MVSRPIQLKLVVVGDGGVGKSSITTSILHREFTDEWDPTIEDSYSTTLTIDSQDYQIEIIDTAGQEEYRSMWGESTVRDADGFIVVYAVDSKESWEEVEGFIHTIRKVKSPDEAPTHEQSAKNTPFPFLLLGNKSDLPPPHLISPSIPLLYSQNLGGLFHLCSAKTRSNIDLAFSEIVLATARAKRSREEWMGRRGTVHGWSGNVAALDPAVEGGIGDEERRDRGVEEEEEGDNGGWDSDPDPEPVEVEKKRQTKNPALKMDRRRSFSVGGLGAHPDTLRGEREEGGCCCVVC